MSHKRYASIATGADPLGDPPKTALAQVIIVIWIELLITLPFTLLTLAFTIEVVLGLRGVPPGPRGHREPRTVIVMPAHDEAAIIGESLARLRPEVDGRTRILVVADNCGDNTAEIARAGGAEVVVRTDAQRRGKGFALAFARDRLAADPPDCVVILDADCAVDRESLKRIASLAYETGRPVQSVNLLRPDLSADPMVQVSNFAFLIKNLVRQTGLARLAGRVHLTGTGMAFPWPLFASAPLATNDIVEDLGLGLDMSTAGRPPLFAPDAFVWSGASSAGGTLKQRARWEGGFIATSMRRSLPLMWDALRKADPRLFWSGLSLSIPPLTLLVLANLAAGALALALVLLGASPLPLIVQAAVGALAAGSIVAAWRKVGRPYLSAAAAARLPLYLLWKLPLYLGLLKGSPKTWLRAGR
ncbi:MAG: Dolichol-phosphate mannosyltransferase in lipid-linked oligosaccharide synthesis cluster [uncultured Sphingomonadaceae bacterium]|uniref:Dolichol-phosphate mannosyltransferase in lipid-linked oligosaccharide synthesis cluster n=1 Tax=uncultured Sphingomonadaceae bacterium TaxID=169976 RepID=A0A6J4SAL8_9SPHN|nr:MAG: Dolichol-phosphate mannosyltransferase in lipid-linked oligosaccharide synthesis cluster [uncultured Sphingomonadaceae bacterium]